MDNALQISYWIQGKPQVTWVPLVTHGIHRTPPLSFVSSPWNNHSGITTVELLLHSSYTLLTSSLIYFFFLNQKMFVHWLFYPWLEHNTHLTELITHWCRCDWMPGSPLCMPMTMFTWTCTVAWMRLGSIKALFGSSGIRQELIQLTNAYTNLQNNPGRIYSRQWFPTNRTSPNSVRSVMYFLIKMICGMY